jgi:predicted  nucleic acid-binding Zn-ribbon protein
LNEKLEAQFGKNVKQLQDSLTQVSNDLKANKQAMAKVEADLKTLETTAKKQVKEISDRGEVERCVQEMVSWVSE